MSLDVVDFHGHWFPPDVVDPSRPPKGATAAVAAAWSLLTDIDAQLEHGARAGVAAQVVGAPMTSLAGAAVVPRAELASRANDALAAAVGRHGDQLAGLATVDAFDGDHGAEEARRAVDELGLPGLMIEATDGELVLSDPCARPTLAFAAERGIPVFAHPVTPVPLAERFARAGGPGVLVARGTESAISTLQLLASGTIGDLEGLQLVIACIGAGALLATAFIEATDGGPLPHDAGRGRLHIDTMGFDPAVVRFAIDAVGVEHVLIGSDWPVMARDASPERVSALFDAVGLAGDDAALVAGGNARRLLRARGVVER